jgi:hypothetical protein
LVFFLGKQDQRIEIKVPGDPLQALEREVSLARSMAPM